MGVLLEVFGLLWLIGWVLGAYISVRRTVIDSPMRLFLTIFVAFVSWFFILVGYVISSDFRDAHKKGD